MASSVDPSQVSARVQGIVLALSSIIILITGKIFHITLTPDDVLSLASQVGGVAGAIWTVKGAIIWIMTKFGKRTPDSDYITH